MSDVRLRELERRFRATGSAEDEAAWLRARAQAGYLDQSKLALAAFLGHDAASIVCPVHPPAPRDLGDWVNELDVRVPNDLIVWQVCKTASLMCKAERCKGRFADAPDFIAGVGAVAAKKGWSRTSPEEMREVVLDVCKAVGRRLIGESTSSVQAAVCETLVAWALDYPDPFRPGLASPRAEAPRQGAQ